MTTKKRQAEIDAYNTRVKPYKVCEKTNPREIDQIRHKAQTSRVNINDWAGAYIQVIQNHPGDVMLDEFATETEAREEADRRNRYARPGFTYYVEFVNATLAELRSLA